MGGREADVAGRKRRALVALLAWRAGRVVAALVDALWGADLRAAPHDVDQQHVLCLRAALGAEAIATRLGGRLS